MADRLRLTNVGQMSHAEVSFGDLTVLVGPQATGKSIFLQFLKLMADRGFVQQELRRHGLEWDDSLDDFFEVYLGEGMQGVWNVRRSRAVWNHKPVDMTQHILRKARSKTESVFFIPARRVLTLSRGWPRPFTDYSPGDPFAVRDFSDKIRLLLETGFGKADALFPEKRRLKSELRKDLDATVFSGFRLGIDKDSPIDDFNAFDRPRIINEREHKDDDQ